MVMTREMTNTTVNFGVAVCGLVSVRSKNCRVSLSVVVLTSNPDVWRESSSLLLQQKFTSL